MKDIKQGPPDKITNYLGKEMTVELKNHHKITGALAYFHLQEQTIHLQDWKEYDDTNVLQKRGKFMVVNRSAWYQLYEDIT